MCFINFYDKLLGNCLQAYKFDFYTMLRRIPTETIRNAHFSTCFSMEAPKNLGLFAEIWRYCRLISLIILLHSY